MKEPAKLYMIIPCYNEEEKELKLVNKLYEVRNEAAFVEYK